MNIILINDRSVNLLGQILEYVPGGDCYSLLRNIGYLKEAHASQYLADVILVIIMIRYENLILLCLNNIPIN